MATFARRRFTLPATFCIAVLSGCGNPPVVADASDVGATSDGTTADIATGDTQTADTLTADTLVADTPSSDTGEPPCADRNAVPTNTDLGCWTCNIATDPAPGMPGCAICRNPYATILPRGDCYRCESDGGAVNTYC